MLGREVVHDVGGLVEVAHDHRARVPERRVDDVPAAGLLQSGLERGAHALDQVRRCRDEERPRLGVVLGLRDQVERRHVCVDVVVGHDRELARPGEAVDPDEARDLSLGLGHIGVARTDDPVHPRDRLGAVRHRTDGLCTAGLGHVRGARTLGRVQHGRRDRPVGQRRGAEHDLADPRDDRGDDRHAHRRRIHRTAAGHVAADRLERPDDLAVAHAVAFLPPLGRDLPLGQVVEPLDQFVERLPELRRRVALGRRQLLVGDQDLAELGAVEPQRQFDEHLVALHEDALEDAGDGVRDGGVDLEPGGLETLAPLAQVEELEHVRTPRGPRDGIRDRSSRAPHERAVDRG